MTQPPLRQQLAEMVGGRDTGTPNAPGVISAGEAASAKIKMLSPKTSPGRSDRGPAGSYATQTQTEAPNTASSLICGNLLCIIITLIQPSFLLSPSDYVLPICA